MSLPDQQIHITIESTTSGYNVIATPRPPRYGPQLAQGSHLDAEAAAAVVLVALRQWDAIIKDRSPHKEGP